jgi:hypothetical protein
MSQHWMKLRSMLWLIYFYPRKDHLYQLDSQLSGPHNKFRCEDEKKINACDVNQISVVQHIATPI